VDVANYTARKGGGGLLGAQTNELALTPSNVNATTFGLKWTTAVDAWVNAQPLYMNGLVINGAPHNVVFVVTANDSVYALDGDTGAQLWQVSLIPSGATAVTGTSVGLVSAPLIGILGTPVIDPATNTMYLVAETSEQNATYFPHRLHALDLATGNEKFGGSVLVNDPQMAPLHKLQRTGLTLANGNVYFGIGSIQDIQPYHGLVFSFNAQTLAQQAAWVSTPTGVEGGVWMGSSAPSVDEDGNIYVTTGNGTLDGTVNFGEAAVKLSPGLQPLDYFAPWNFAAYNASDVDLGSGAIIVVPDQAGSHPHELIACGKPTPVYVLDRDNLGQLGATSDNIIQRLDNQVGAFAASTNSVQACFTGPAMWGQNVYFGGKYDVLKMFKLDPNTGLLSSAPVSQGTLAFGYPGADPVVSSSGATNGIVWAIDTKTDALIATDATNLANILFSGSLSAPPIRWTVPTVINGHVYVAEQGKVFGFGLK
jgi:outer membrane protein assembly factor BamB